MTLTPQATTTPVRRELSNEDYHADKSSVSSSHLKLISQSPKLYWHRYLDPNAPKQTPTAAMRLGTLVHSMVLEPDKVHQEFGVLSAARNTKLGKAELKEFSDAGLEAVSRSDWDLAVQVAASVHKHPAAAKLLSQGEPETSWFFTDPDTGLKCKIRPDWMSDDYIIDLKTTQDASPKAFARSTCDLSYHLQQAFYLLPFQEKRFVFIAVEKTYPFQVGVYELSPDAKGLGEVKCSQAMHLLKKCRDTNHWPGYSDELQTLNLPDWAFNS